MNSPDCSVRPLVENPRFETPLALAFTALILYGAAVCLPFATAAKFGKTHAAYLISGVTNLWSQGDWHLSILVLGCGLVAPLLLTGSLCVLLLGARRQQPRPALRACLRLAIQVEQWSMPEVQMLGVIVAFIKLSALVSPRPEPGLWCYGAAAFFTLLAWKTCDPMGISRVLFPAPKSA